MKADIVVRSITVLPVRMSAGRDSEEWQAIVSFDVTTDRFVEIGCSVSVKRTEGSDSTAPLEMTGVIRSDGTDWRGPWPFVEFSDIIDEIFQGYVAPIIRERRIYSIGARPSPNPDWLAITNIRFTIDIPEQGHHADGW